MEKHECEVLLMLFVSKNEIWNIYIYIYVCVNSGCGDVWPLFNICIWLNENHKIKIKINGGPIREI